MPYTMVGLSHHPGMPYMCTDSAALCRIILFLMPINRRVFSILKMYDLVILVSNRSVNSKHKSAVEKKEENKLIVSSSSLQTSTYIRIQIY